MSSRLFGSFLVWLRLVGTPARVCLTYRGAQVTKDRVKHKCIRWGIYDLDTMCYISNITGKKKITNVWLSPRKHRDSGSWTVNEKGIRLGHLAYSSGPSYLWRGTIRAQFTVWFPVYDSTRRDSAGIEYTALLSHSYK